MSLSPRFLAIAGALSAALLAFTLPQASRAAEFSQAADQRDREDRARLSRQASRGARRGDGGTAEAPAGRRSRQAQGRGQGARQAVVQFAGPGGARQSEGQRHLRRVLRLQLRLLQARHGRHAHAVEERPQSQGRAQGIPGARAGLGRGRASGGGRAHAGAEEISRIPHQASWRAAATPTERARWPWPRRSGSTWPACART